MSSYNKSNICCCLIGVIDHASSAVSFVPLPVVSVNPPVMAAALPITASVVRPSWEPIGSVHSSAMVAALPIVPVVNSSRVASTEGGFNMCFNHDKIVHDDPLGGSGYAISVCGTTYHLPGLNMSALARADLFAKSYQHIFIKSGQVVIPSMIDMEANLLRLRSFFAPTHAESEALADASDFQWPVSMFDRDRELLARLGSLDAVLAHHAAIHRSKGVNEERLSRWLSADPNYTKLVDVAEHGANVDADG